MWNSYVMERFAAAVAHLALQEGRLSERLTRASGNLMLISPESLPRLLRTDFRNLKQLLTRTEVRRRLGWRFWWGGPWGATRLVIATKPECRN